jgi:chromosome partitioning protein
LDNTMPQIITVSGLKGGTSKTTTAYHLACYFSQYGATVLVDGDHNRSATAWASRSPEPLPFKVVDLLSAAKAAKKHDYMILDTQIQPDEVEAIADGCDLLLLPTTTSALSVESVLNIAGQLQSIGTEYRVLFSLVDPRAKATADKARESLLQHGFPILHTQVRSYAVYEAAALQGVPVFKATGQKFAKIAWGDYVALGDELREVLKNA